MKQTGYDMLYLTACAVNNITPDPSCIALIDPDELFKMCQYHSMTAIVCTALESAGISNKKFTEAKLKAIRKNILLDSERKKICGTLEQYGIWYMPLKGTVLKELYPQTDVRQMSDNDILFDKTYRKTVLKIMKNLGYSAKYYGKGNHDVYIKPPIYNYEMHTELFHISYNEKWTEYYSQIKNKLIQDSNTEYGYHFTDEDFYVYITAHEYKHYNISGTGLRSLLDRYIFLMHKEKILNWQYIQNECKKLGIAQFEKQNRNLCKKVLSEPELPRLSPEEKELLEYHFSCGTYGTIENEITKRMEKFNYKTVSKTRFKYIFSRVFPSLEFYRFNYPFFYRHKIFLPLIWFFRLAKGITIKRKYMKNELCIIFKFNKVKKIQNKHK